jgi:hypothetical protein
VVLVASFDIDVQYKPGKLHEAPNFLSQIPAAAVTQGGGAKPSD